MDATILDLRYRMKDVLRALDRNEKVTILYHGKPRGFITPHTAPTGKRVAEHPFFNLRRDGGPAEEQMEKLRGDRYRDL